MSRLDLEQNTVTRDCDALSRYIPKTYLQCYTRQIHFCETFAEELRERDRSGMHSQEITGRGPSVNVIVK